jgi:hypothetical protein
MSGRFLSIILKVAFIMSNCQKFCIFFIVKDSEYMEVTGFSVFRTNKSSVHPMETISPVFVIESGCRCRQIVTDGFKLHSWKKCKKT